MHTTRTSRSSLQSHLQCKAPSDQKMVVLIPFSRGTSFFQHSTSLGQILAGLAEAEGIDWSSTKIYFADERCVPLDHSDRYLS